MTPYYQDDWLTVMLGDCREVMASMEPESVNCVVTSPPYWGLRDYGTPGQLGLEPTPEAYVESMVAVFREVRRVLRSDGTVWLNLGDSYATGTKHGGMSDKTGLRPYATKYGKAIDEDAKGTRKVQHGLKDKDLVGIPWRVAFALQADGWYLRSDIIWSKPNPMPESVTDRPTKSHEYLFLLSKSPRYYFDNEAVRLPVSPNWREGAGAPMPELGDHRREDGARGHQAKRTYAEAKGANVRTVWTIATQPYPGAHFATFPQALVEPCIKAGTSERGVCPECGAPWTRVVEREREFTRPIDADPKYAADFETTARTKVGLVGRPIVTKSETTGWRPTCSSTCDYAEVDHQSPVPAVVLDPFAGSGTTGLVAQRLSRRAVLIDLNADYLDQVMDRNRDIPLGLGA